jgi:hypothetical protein
MSPLVLLAQWSTWKQNFLQICSSMVLGWMPLQEQFATNSQDEIQ